MALRGITKALLGPLILQPGPTYKAPNVEIVDLTLGADKVSQTGEQYICATTDCKSF